MNQKSDNSCSISVVVPVFNEAGNIARLAHEIDTALQGQPFELILVDDQSTDDTRNVLSGLKAEIANLRVLTHTRNAGQSRAIRTGALAARGRILCTLDGDGQNVPADLPGLVKQLQRKDAPADLAMVGGERQNRKDSRAKKLGSWLANGIRGKLLGDGSTDTGCGIKAMYKHAYLRLPYFDHQHRYLPALMQREGYLCEYLPVQHRARMSGVSKYSNLGRLIVAFRDLAGILWLRARARSPGRIEED